jgi:RNA polymerase sigma-70 factor, ECF subfamily
MTITVHASDDPLPAARRGDQGAFERLVAPQRGPLLAHCYRMLGSLQDAEDALQETLVRAWRGLPQFGGRSAVGTWLHRIATNVCLRAIERRPHLTLPVGHVPPADPAAPLAPPAERRWIEPLPDALAAIGDGAASPEARYEQRESVELAFVAALQGLPPRQRAALLMRDVLGYAPAEIAEALGATPAAIHSALQRARATAAEALPERSQQSVLRAVGDAAVRDTVARWVRAWEEGDVDDLVAMLVEDAAYAMPPTPTWYRGRDDIRAFLLRRPFAPGRRWRTRRVAFNGQLAFVADGPDAEGGWAPHAVEVLTLAPDGRVAEVVAFLDPALVARVAPA